MILITDPMRARLLANGAADADIDHFPVVKLFNPTGAATWLLTELDADGDTLFGLCDLGFGFPELGSVSLAELASVKVRSASASSATCISSRAFRSPSMPKPPAFAATSPRPSDFCGRQQTPFQSPPSFRPTRRNSSADRRKNRPAAPPFGLCGRDNLNQSEGE